MCLSRTELNQLPKIELHCHLDGSISMATIRVLAEKAGISMPESDEALRLKITAPENAESLLDYLAPFDFVLPMLQTQEALELAAYDLISQAKADHVRYIEVRFAPTLHTAGGLSLEQVVVAVTKGLAKGEADFSVKSNALLCGMRHESVATVMTVVDLFSKGELTHLAGFDLAGGEADGYVSDFASVLEVVTSRHIPLTLHAGECGCAQNVMDAIELGATRIGHGVAIKDMPDKWAELIDKKITLEMAPTSNIQTKAIDKAENYPFKTLFDAGVRVTINTDNRTVSDTTLTDEYVKLADWFGFDEAVFRQVARYAFEASFMSPQQRADLADEFML
ncbi:adenosine deaminase [Lactococcus piscium]|uniref:Adenosine deaminase n=1 Tax=Pseudolactococcus piscium TaxID=1364 RepID=A0A2A5S3T9_9LACT|nr:adenosine deaminase [Lactococcus piscium]PCS08149.1 adenosine deaminase [Lactococcus piscium]